MRRIPNRTIQRLTVCEEFRRRRRAPYEYDDTRDDQGYGHIHKHGPSRLGVIRPCCAYKRRRNRKGRLPRRVVINLLDSVTTDGGEPLAHEVVRADALRLAGNGEKQAASVPPPAPQYATREAP